ncbi:HesA/MoeB/ThiF family protein [Klebsiella pneumoniae]|nr:HesA/MoeB/ThiF family protein [Klebsiella pneumoniae]
MTQAAVSHQIKSLEDFLGLKLFRRRNRSLLLTEEGQSYFQDIKEIFSQLTEATRKLQARSAKGALTVSLLPSFAIQWLVPRLTSFNSAYPDAIDSVRPKAALIAWCRRYKVPLVTTGGAGGQIDPTQIQVADLAKTIQDPLAAKLRERLKSQFGVVKNSKGKLGVDCVFSTEALVYPQADGSVCAMKSTAEGPKRMDCASGFGAATMVTATFGFVAVSHALKKMLAKAQRDAAASGK